MKYIGAILFLLFSSSTLAQIQKGDWLIRGAGSMLTAEFTGRSTSQTNINLDITLGYFITDQILVGGNTLVRFGRTSSRTKNELFGRYYFKDTILHSRFYTELRWVLDRSAPTVVGTSNPFEFRSGVLAAGLNRFISPQLAIEAQLDYYYYTKLIGFGRQNQIRSTHFETVFRLQYFFRYRDWKIEREMDYRNSLQKGTWFLGGRMTINERIGQSFFTEQNFNPVVGWFWKKNWAIGVELDYYAFVEYSFVNLGLYPFSRYYLNVGRKKKLFAELQAGYFRNTLRNSSLKATRETGLQYGFAFGLSNFINENVSFDISYLLVNRSELENTSFSGLAIKRKGLNLALHYFISK